jgi:hypothetical protein
MSASSKNSDDGGGIKSLEQGWRVPTGNPKNETKGIKRLLDTGAVVGSSAREPVSFCADVEEIAVQGWWRWGLVRIAVAGAGIEF